MRDEPNNRLDEYRQIHPILGASDAGANWGYFELSLDGALLRIVSSGSDSESGWEHVSVSLHHRCPTWKEMARVKSLFWDESETVVQFHPRKSEYVNYMPFCLHLWKRVGSEYELPPTLLVGPKPGERVVVI